MVERYAAGDGGEGAAAEGGGDGRAFVSVNWVLSEAPLDLETELAFGFLDYLLLGTSAQRPCRGQQDGVLLRSVACPEADDRSVTRMLATGRVGRQRRSAQCRARQGVAPRRVTWARCRRRGAAAQGAERQRPGRGHHRRRPGRRAAAARVQPGPQGRQAGGRREGARCLAQLQCGPCACKAVLPACLVHADI